MAPANRIVLLRGINLGSRNRVPMPALRELLTEAGFADVRSYVQSGNVVLSSDLPADAVARACEEQIAERFGLQIAVVARSRDELAGVIERNPLAKVASDPKRYQVSFLASALDPEVLAKLEEAVIAPERLVALDRELYAWHPKGVARSRLWNALAGKNLGVAATARNWTTVTKLLELADHP